MDEGKQTMVAQSNGEAEICVVAHRICELKLIWIKRVLDELEIQVKTYELVL